MTSEVENPTEVVRLQVAEVGSEDNCVLPPARSSHRLSSCGECQTWQRTPMSGLSRPPRERPTSRTEELRPRPSQGRCVRFGSSCLAAGAYPFDPRSDDAPPPSVWLLFECSVRIPICGSGLQEGSFLLVTHCTLLIGQSQRADTVLQQHLPPSAKILFLSAAADISGSQDGGPGTS